MRHHSSRGSLRSTVVTASAVAGLLLLAGCGDGTSSSTSSADPTASTSESPAGNADLPQGQGDWLLGITVAEGADAEVSSTVYVTYDPSTGEASARKVPGVQAGSTGDGSNAALLVSTDRTWAVPDVAVASKETKDGTVTLYSTTDQATKKLDLRALTKQKDLKPVAHAFDPQRPEVLRVVDTRERVWAVDVAAGKASSEGRLAQGPWVFTNGFNHNTGVPWVESIDSADTLPPANGVADTGPIQRSGGTVLPSASDALDAMPKSPCGLAGAFTTAEGTTWAFCADKPEVSAYTLAKGDTEWQAYGTPSSPVAPVASGVPLVLPPVQ